MFDQNLSRNKYQFNLKYLGLVNWENVDDMWTKCVKHRP